MSCQLKKKIIFKKIVTKNHFIQSSKFNLSIKCFNVYIANVSDTYIVKKNFVTWTRTVRHAV